MAEQKLADTIQIVAPDLLAMPISELELSVRSANCLKNDNIETVGELLQKSEADLLRSPNFGRKSLKEVKDVLTGLGLGLYPRHEPELAIIPDHWITEQTITMTFWFCPDYHAHESEPAARECAARHGVKAQARALAEAKKKAADEAQKLAVEKRQRERAAFKKKFADSEISKSGLDIRVAEALCEVGVVDRATFREKFVKDNAFDLKSLAYVPTVWVGDYPDILRWVNSEQSSLGESARDPLQNLPAR